MEILTRKKYKEKEISYVCPVCGAEVRDVLYIYSQNDKEHKIFRCSECDFMFARPVFLQNLEDRQLDHVYDAELLNSAFLRKLHGKLIVWKEISYVKRILGRGDFTLLDIGCGTGWTTNIWKESGFKATGIEPSRVRGTIASDRYGIKIIPDYFENFTTTEKFDVVVMRHMVEHFADPYNMIAKARSLLNPRGVVLVVVPNINCIGRYIFGGRWTWGIPYHCNFFNQGVLCRLLRRAGFDILKTYQTPSPLSYPESFARLFKLTTKMNKALSMLSLVPFAPLVAVGYIMGLSENITLIATIKKD